jgi:hypothetical protein
MDILVSCNFERLPWFLAYKFAAETGMDDEWNKKQASQEAEAWLKQLETKGGFGVHPDILKSARRDSKSEGVSDVQTPETIKQFILLLLRMELQIATFPKEGIYWTLTLLLASLHLCDLFIRPLLLTPITFYLLQHI